VPGTQPLLSPLSARWDGGAPEARAVGEAHSSASGFKHASPPAVATRCASCASTNNAQVARGRRADCLAISKFLQLHVATVGGNFLVGMRSGLLLALVLQLGEEHTADAGDAPRSHAPRAPFLGSAGIYKYYVICGHRGDWRMCAGQAVQALCMQGSRSSEGGGGAGCCGRVRCTSVRAHRRALILFFIVYCLCFMIYCLLFIAARASSCAAPDFKRMSERVYR